MEPEQETPRDLAAMVITQVGRLAATDDAWMPYRLIDSSGASVEAVSAWFAELQASGRAEATLRSYGLDLLRWFRFCWAVGLSWDDATRADARDFSRWLQVADKPARSHWRHPARVITGAGAAGVGQRYSAAVRAHSETVLRAFYDFHRDAHSGPAANPFPLGRARRGGRAHAHHNPMEPHRNERVGAYRPKVATRIPRAVPDAEFNEIFARLRSHRDRALVAFYVSTGARASELLSTTAGGVNPERQLIGVVRKGTRAIQQLPASTDAFVWLRLYQLEMDGGSNGREGKVHDAAKAPVVDLGELVVCSGQADAEAFDLAQPSLGFGFGDASGEVVGDLDEAAPLGGVGPQHRAAHTGVLVDAGGREGPGAGPDRYFAALEVTQELLPLVVGGDTVFLARAQRTPPGEEGEVGLDGLLGIDGLVAEGDVDVLMPGDDLGDVGGQAVQDGVGDEHPPEVVRAVVQGAAFHPVDQPGLSDRGGEDLEQAAMSEPPVLAAYAPLQQARRWW